jgi:hypothetical protein
MKMKNDIAGKDRMGSRVRNLAKKGQLRIKQLRTVLIRIRHVSAATNIYHCCTQKTASQWIRSIFSDVRVYKYSGLKPYHYQTMQRNGYDERNLTERSFEEPFPARTIVSPLYIDYDNFAALPKPDAYKAFFVMRDPRDIIVSWYFSSKYSHSRMGDVARIRRKLHDLPLSEGLVYMIRHLKDFGLFAVLETWLAAEHHDGKVRLLRFEEMTGPQKESVFLSLFDFLDINLPEKELAHLLEDYSFERLSGGRSKGRENKESHYRKGTPGDWKNYFDIKVMDTFRETTGDLIERLGYA